MFTKTLSIAAALASVAFSVEADISYESMGTFKLKNAAFPMIEKFDDSEEFLLMSSFGALSSGHVYVVPGVKDAVKSGDVSSLKSVKLDTPKFEWPNEVRTIPHDVFDGQRAIIVPDGFLVPTKTNGGVYVIQMDDEDITKTQRTVKLTATKKGYFYHMGCWVDVNGDGRKDFITARSNAKADGGELLWLEHPEGGLDQVPWTEHVLTSGPDVGIECDMMEQYDYELVVFAAEFFTEKVSVHRVSLVDGALIESRIIDDGEIINAYSVALVDLNSDGKKQLLVNNHEKDQKTNGIWAYEVPKDLMKGDYTKYPVATGFKNKFSLTVPNMAPGFPYAVWPEASTQGHDPAHILVAGDGTYSVHLLQATPDETNPYARDSMVLKDEGGTVGALAFSDLDEDGWLEMWVPNYDKSKVEVFKFSELTSAVPTAQELFLN